MSDSCDSKVAAQRQQCRDWYQKNKDAKRAYMKEYESRPGVKEQRKAYLKAWLLKNKEGNAEKRAARHAANWTGIIRPQEWTEGELQAIKHYYSTRNRQNFSLEDFSLFLERPINSIICQAKLLRCKNPARVILSGENHPMWAGKETKTDKGSRIRTRKMYQLGPCERCGGIATERHHKDSNPKNNDKSNIAIVCHRCHMVIDGRLAKSIARLNALPPRQATPAKPCMICNRLYKPLCKGRCCECAAHFRKHGTERPSTGFKRPNGRSKGYVK